MSTTTVMTMMLAASTAAATLQTAEPVIEVSQEASTPYDPFAPGRSDTELSLTIRDAPPGAILTAEPSAGAPLVMASPDGAELPYLLRDEAGRAARQGARLEVILPDPGIDEAMVREARLDLRLVAEPGIVAPPGRYEATLDLSVLDANGALLTEFLAVPAAIEVIARTQVVLAGTSGAFDPAASVGFVDFGTLETGERRRLFVTVRANAPSQITVTSENGGRMTLRDAGGAAVPGGGAISYDVTLDGAASGLGAPLVLRREPPLNASGVPYPFDIVIGTVSGAFAGTYRDDLLVEVRPD